MKALPSTLGARTTLSACALALLIALTGCSGATSVLDIEVGDCLNDAQADGTVQNVQKVDCSEPHDSEVFAVFEAEPGANDTMPEVDELTAQANEGCDPAFEAFIGLPYSESAYTYASYTPTLSSWFDDGGRDITCVAFALDGKTTGTLEGIEAP